jgi:hypothetical protein
MYCKILNFKEHSHDWVGGEWERHCRAALASLDSFVSFSHQGENESLAGEAKVRLKGYLLKFVRINNIVKCTFNNSTL